MVKHQTCGKYHLNKTSLKKKPQGKTITKAKYILKFFFLIENTIYYSHPVNGDNSKFNNLR